LDSRKFPGKTIKEKLFWAGYSGKDKEGIAEALERREDIVSKINYQFSDFESQGAVRMYKKVIQEILSKPELTIKDKIKIYFELYFSLKSLKFWRNIAIIFTFFLAIKLLAETDLGNQVTENIVNFTNFVISWIFVAIVAIIIAVILAINLYLETRTKIKIKE
jgi:hypothetical protein